MARWRSSGSDRLIELRSKIDRLILECRKRSHTAVGPSERVGGEHPDSASQKIQICAQLVASNEIIRGTYPIVMDAIK